MVTRLGLRRFRPDGGGDGIAGRLGRLIEIGKQQVPLRVAQVPLDIVGEHALKNVRPDAIGGALVNRAHVQIHGLERAKRAS